MIVYKITNLKNNKVYIGKTVKTLEKRIRDHFYYSSSSNAVLHKALRKYGVENFKYEALEECICLESLNEREIFWIKFYNSLLPAGYNMTAGGDGGILVEISDETRQKHRDALKRRDKSIQDKFVYANCGKDFCKEHRLKLSNASKITNSKKHKCTYCGKETNFRNLKRWHNENCKLSPTFNKDNRKVSKKKEYKKLKCKYCNCETIKTNIDRWHNENCKFK